MLRALVVLLCLASLRGLAIADGSSVDQKEQTVEGKFKSYKDGILILDVKATEAAFSVAEDFEVTRVVDAQTKRIPAKAFFANLPAGRRVRVTTEGDKVVAIADGVVADK